MSLEKDITMIKQLVEQNDNLVFKPASPENITNREEIMRQKEEDAKKAHAAALYDNAEMHLPGCVEKLRQRFGNEALVQTAIAYADSEEPQMLLGVSKTLSIRDIDWDGVWTDAKTFLDQCKIVGGYNGFNIDVANDLVFYFKGKEFRLAREGSVAVYIRPVEQQKFNYLNSETGARTYKFDEASLEGGNTVRLWWD